MLRQFRIAAAFAAVVAVTGCGIKGPLVLPPAPPVAAPSPGPAPLDSAPAVPATPDAAKAPAPTTAPAERKP